MNRSTHDPTCGSVMFFTESKRYSGFNVLSMLVTGNATGRGIDSR